MNIHKIVEQHKNQVWKYYGYKKYKKLFFSLNQNCILVNKFVSLFVNLKEIYLFYRDMSSGDLILPSLVLNNDLLSSLLSSLSSSICLKSSFKKLIIQKPNDKQMSIQQFIKKFNKQKNNCFSNELLQN